MDIQEMEKNRKDEDFDFNIGLLKLPSGEARLQEKDYKEKIEKEDNKLQRDREYTIKEWKKIWEEIWIPEVVPSVDPDIQTKRDFIIKITMEVTLICLKKFFMIYIN